MWRPRNEQPGTRSSFFSVWYPFVVPNEPTESLGMASNQTTGPRDGHVDILLSRGRTWVTPFV